MKILSLFTIALLSLMKISVAVAADVSPLRLYEWRIAQSPLPLILPVKSYETPEQAAHRYIRELEKQPGLMELFEGRSPDITGSEFKPFGQKDAPEQRALIMANLPKDYTSKSLRVANFSRTFQELGTQSYVLPIVANLGLTQNETRDLFQKIADHFPLLINLGGDDVTPALYKEKNLHARNTIPVRDIFEVALIKAYTAAEKGFHFAVCRGSQITAVALGYKLVQDIPSIHPKAIYHGDSTHGVRLLPTKHGFLADALKPFPNPQINSLHHQAIVYKDGGPLELAAVGPDGITEALEAKNGRTFIVQFHPELMENSIGRAVLEKVVQQKNRIFRNRCEQSFSF